MEHFRPKGAVRLLDPEKRFIRAKIELPDGTLAEHPGYFWLAYDVDNLMPACDACNSSSETGGAAKLDKFPVLRHHLALVKLSPDQVRKMSPLPWPSARWGGYYYLRPCQLDDLEGRALVHPMLDDPRTHIHFLPRGLGESRGTEIGDFTIQILKLDRDELNRERDTRQQAAYNHVLLNLMMDQNRDTLFNRVRPDLQRYLDGEEAFSAAVLDYLEYQEKDSQFQMALQAARL